MRSQLLNTASCSTLPPIWAVRPVRRATWLLTPCGNARFPEKLKTCYRVTTSFDDPGNSNSEPNIENSPKFGQLVQNLQTMRLKRCRSWKRAHLVASVNCCKLMIYFKTSVEPNELRQVSCTVRAASGIVPRPPPTAYSYCLFLKASGRGRSKK